MARSPRGERFLDTDRRPHSPGRQVCSKGNEFIVTYGGGVGDVGLRALLEFHRKEGKLAAELPQLDEGRINGGFFVLKRRVLDYIGPDTILERDPLEGLARDGQLTVSGTRGTGADGHDARTARSQRR